MAENMFEASLVVCVEVRFQHAIRFGGPPNDNGVIYNELKKFLDEKGIKPVPGHECVWGTGYHKGFYEEKHWNDLSSFIKLLKHKHMGSQ
jgi:hypothetical protein